jgi:pristinamycin I synthase 3 and 4
MMQKPSDPVVIERRIHAEDCPSAGDGSVESSDPGPTLPARRPDAVSVPLSFEQERIWFVDELQGATPEYNLPEAMRLRGRLNLDALQRSINAIVSRHEILRTRFADGEAGPVQVVMPELRVDLPVEDLSSLDEDGQRKSLSTALSREWEQPFDLRHGPLLRARVLKLGPEDHVFLRTFHYMVFDSQSAVLFNRELGVLYEAFDGCRETLLPSLPFQYGDYASWQRESLDSRSLDANLRYWKDQLAGIPEELELPMDRARGKRQTSSAHDCRYILDGQELKAFREFCSVYSITPYVALVSAFAALLRMYSGTNDIVIGSPLSARRDPRLKGMMGFFDNPLVMRFQIDPEWTVERLVSSVRSHTLLAHQHKDVPFQRLVEELAPRRRPNLSPLFQVEFRVEDNPPLSPRFKALAVEPVLNERQRLGLDLGVDVWVHEDFLGLQWTYSADLFDRWRIEQMSRHYARLLGDMVKNPAGRIRELDLMTSQEKNELLFQRNRTEKDLRSELTLHSLFEEHVARDPEALAIIHENGTLTYGELNARANQLAHYLRKMGVGPEVPVGICLERSFEMVIGVLSILKAGAAYVPIDPYYPADRIALILDHSNVPLLLSTHSMQNRLPATQARTIELDLDWEEIAGCPKLNLPCVLCADNAAYVIYTSGSTGIPKGVVVTHRGIASLWQSQSDSLSISSNSRVLQFASLSFDASFFELLMTLGLGAALVLIREDMRTGSDLQNTLVANRVTHAVLPPAVLPTLENPDQVPLETLLVAGEACSGRVVADWSSRRRMFNGYGPTETTVMATIAGPLAGSQAPPIGRPICNTRVYVLDDRLQPVATGVTGELYIAGAGLARGYLGQSVFTAERFVADPFGDSGARMYRTGDQVRWRPDAALEFMGRSDTQVKLRGHRIELHEIEAALRQNPQVRDATVIKRDEGSKQQLLGYVIARHEETSSEMETQEGLDRWKELFETTYTTPSPAANDFNIVGWNSSYTGKPIPPAEMRIWVEETVKRLKALSSERVLEIGCGTGLLLTRMASSCKSYVGLDFSPRALAQLQLYLNQHDEMRHVVLREASAHELSDILADSFDLVILNSVTQLFPNMRYLAGVLQEATRITRPGGHVFVGDVRSLPLLEGFHTSVQLYRASAATPLKMLRDKIWYSRQSERELTIDPAFFLKLPQVWQKVGRAETAWKTGTYDNELNSFRYDVTLYLGDKELLDEPQRVLKWDGSGSWRYEVRHLISVDPNTPVVIHGIKNRRTARVMRALELMADPPSGMVTVAHLRAACANASYGEDPSCVVDFALSLGAKIWFKQLNVDGSFDLVVNPAWTKAYPSRMEVPDRWYERLGNFPADHDQSAKLGQALREALRTTVPEYMVPEAIVVMDAWPVTPNGKLDRSALPLPESGMEPQGRAPRKPEEELLCAIFAEVLGRENITTDANFFDLGGHSLIAAQLVSRVRASFDVELPIRAIFEAPTVSQLLLRMQSSTRDRLPALRPQHRPAHLPLSFGQQRLWFLQQLENQNTDYNWPEAVYLLGDLNTGALERAVNRIVERHEILRTHYDEMEGTAVQIVEPMLRIDIPLEDLSSVSEMEQQERVACCFRQEWEQPFDLSRGPLLRLKLFRLGPRTHVLLRTIHHIVWDFWSESIFRREFALLYSAFHQGLPDPLSPPPVQYADFALWQRGLGEESLVPSLNYWKKQLANIPQELELPKDCARGAHSSNEASVWTTVLPDTELLALKQMNRSSGATLYMTLLAVFAVLLERYSGQTDIVLGSPIANRQDPQLEELLGFFLNSVVMRIQVSRRQSFRQLVSAVRTVTLDAYRHFDLPFERLVEELSPQRILNTMPLFQVVFELRNTPAHEQYLQNLEVQPFAGDLLRVRCDLELHAGESDGSLEFDWIYNRQLFDAWRIEQMARHFIGLLKGLVSRPDDALDQATLLTREEQTQLLEIWNNTTLDWSDKRSVHERFAEHAARTPDDIAVVAGGTQHTYAQLNERANRLAHRLQRFGIGPEARVSICLERGIDALTSILAVLKAGGAYVPLDPAYPQQRLLFMIRDAQSEIVITQSQFRDQFANCEAGIICLEQDWQDISRESAANPETRCTPENLAYIIYTSGSAGKPKGVLITHSGLSNVIAESVRIFGIKHSSRVAQLASLSFDASVLEIFSAFHAGAGLYMVDSDTLMSGPQFSRLLQANAISTIAIPPSLLNLIPVGEYPALQTIVAGGEVCPDEIAARWSRGRKFLNAYAPTESTIYSTVFEWQQHVSKSWQSPPVGRPIANTQIYILDRELYPVPVGVRGEIYIGGAGVARGYWQRAGLTAERFLPDPFAGQPGSRLYRSGDMGCYRPDGNIEFMGRADQQVKIRGFRVELGEIESVLSGHPAVRDAAIVMREDISGEKRLVGYVVPAAGYAINAAELGLYLGRYLPDHMLPAAIVPLKQLPLTVHGKLDSENLPSPDFRADQEYRRPRTPEEEILCDMFGNVLKLNSVGIGDNFFQLGGHSLLAARLSSQIRSVLGAELGVRAIFEAPTVERLAARIRGSRCSRIPLAPVPRPKSLPISYAQQRLWLINRFRGSSAEYNMPQAFHLRGELNKEALQKTIDAIVARHEILRTRFGEEEGVAVQIIEPSVRISVGLEDLSTLDEPAQQARLAEAFALECEHPFDLPQGPLLRLKLLKFREKDHVLLRTFHHIVCDGWSLGVFEREFELLYDAFLNGRENPLQPLPVQYADFTLWQREQLAEETIANQLAYWKRQLSGIPEELELPKDRPRELYQTFAAGTYRMRFEQKLLEDLKQIAHASQATLYMTLLSAFAVLLERYTGQPDIVLGSPIANRDDIQLEDMIGFFVNSLAIRVRVKPEGTFRELLSELRTTTLEAYQHSDVSFERVVEEISPRRSLNRTPIFQVAFGHYHMPSVARRLGHLEIQPVVFDDIKTRFDLELHVSESAEEVELHWVFNRNLFTERRIQGMARHYETLLKSIVARPDGALYRLPILTEREQTDVMPQASAPGTHLPAETCVHQLFEQQVERVPESVALIYEDETLTYSQLNERANRLARYLKKQGIGPDIPVAIFVERCPEMIVAMLAVLKAGGAYLPLDPNAPAERLALMLKDSEVPLILTKAAWRNIVPQTQAALFCLDADWERLEGESSANLQTLVRPDNVAYVIYTSGSTGQPKGTEVPHRSIPGFFWGAAYANYDDHSVLLQHSSVSWDGFTLELWPALLRGGRTVLYHDRLLTAHDLAAYVERYGVTVLWLTSSLFSSILETHPASLAGIRELLVGGEALSVPHVRKALDILPNVKLVNGYGPSECTVFSTCYEIPRDLDQDLISVPIGRPVGDRQVYLLDRWLNPVPQGCVGEIYISGPGVARGYLRRPALTAERFVADPFSHDGGKRLYRTGDLARWSFDGLLEFIGRADQQVKIRGFRIELEEVEAALARHSGVKQAAAAVSETNGEKRLTGYWVPKAENAPDEGELHDYLKQILPDYMVPSALVQMPALPLTATGKINRNALPAFNIATDSHAPVVAPQDEVQRAIASVWRQLLRREDIGIFDNFFDLGGHSLLLVRLHGALQKLTPEPLPLLDLFQYPTIASFAQHMSTIGQRQSGDLSKDPNVSALAQGKAGRRERFNRRTAD